MPHLWKKNVQPEDLTRAKVVGITLTTPGIQTGPIHKITLNEKGEVTHQENTPEWGRAFETFPPTFKDLSEISKWSFELLKDCYGCGDIIEQKVAVLETFEKPSMLEEIKKDVQERINSCTDSRQPSGDEISMAWLLWEIDRLNEVIRKQYVRVQQQRPNTIECIPMIRRSIIRK